MDKVNIYNVTLTKTVELEMHASSPDEAIKRACEIERDDGMMWEKDYDKIECQEIGEFYCPVCGSTLTDVKLNIENNIIEHLMSCINDDCALDWTVTTDKANGNFLGIHRYFHG